MLPSLLAGLPPFGLGMYGRNTWREGYPLRFVVIAERRTDAPAQVAAARAAGVTPWLYSGPDSWTPSEWRASLARIVEKARTLGCEGIVADPEGGWPDLPTARRNAEALALGQALAGASSTTRVGVTSYPLFPALDALAEGCGRSVWGSPQIYGRTSQDPDAFAAWFDRWRARFGSRCIPSIAGWASSPALSTPAGFRAYLAALPRAPGAIVWDEAGDSPAWIDEALSEYSPGGNAAGTAGLAALTLAQHPPAVALAVVALVIVAVLATKGR